MKNTTVGAWLLLLAAVLATCTDATLETLPLGPPPVLDNKLRISGTLCTQNPEDLVFPLRVLFLVDASESMLNTDPPDPATGFTQRERAVDETATEILNKFEDARVGVIRFSTEAQPLTQVYNTDGTFESFFTQDIEFVREQLPRLRDTDRKTNFYAALDEAYSEIRYELNNAPAQSLPLSTYHIILITDGMPDAEGGDARRNTRESLLDTVGDIMDLATYFHMGRLAISTAFISSNDPTANAAAGELLADMAERGKGTFRSFASSSALNFLYIDLSALRRVFALSTLVAMNINGQVIGDLTLADSDGDGLADVRELDIGTNPRLPDSDGDGCSDGMEYRLHTSGLDPLDGSDCGCYVAQDCVDNDSDGACDCRDSEGDTDTETDSDGCCTDADGDKLCDCIDADGDSLCDASNFPDADGDGLFDCEERNLATQKYNADGDRDGLPDITELRMGTSVTSDDADDDYDWDFVPNGEEVRSGTDPLQRNSWSRAASAYRYETKEKEVKESTACYEFNIENISLTEVIDPGEDTWPRGAGAAGLTGRNRILIFAGEVPHDDPESYALFRVACVEAVFRAAGNYKDPPSGRVKLDEKDFVKLEEFDAATHCVSPGGG